MTNESADICPGELVARPASPAAAVKAVSANRERVYEIDLLRFIAAFSVLLFHYTFRGSARDNLTDFYYPGVIPVTRYGYLGVQLFFIISGFVISMSARGSTPRRFVISRVVRLYPAFWVCCTITFVATLLFGGSHFSVSARQYLINLTMLNGYVKVLGIDGVYWTLAIEMQFYLLIFLLLLFKQFDRLQFYLALWLGVVVLLKIHPNRYLDFVLISRYAGCFIAGGIFYLARSTGWTWPRIAILAVSYLTTLFDVALDVQAQSFFYRQPFSPLVGCLWVTVFFLVFIVITRDRPGLFRSPKFLVLGALTYPLYLIHQNVGYMIFNRLGPHVNRSLLFCGVVAAVIGIAYLVNAQVERRYATRFRRILERCLPGS